MSLPSTETRSGSATAVVEPPAALPDAAADAAPRTPASRPGSARVLLVIPAHNEEMNIGGLIDELRGLKYPYDVIVVDDASLDGTAAELERRGQRHIHLCTNLGYGAAVQTGFKYALEHGYDFVVQMDGDGQHDPASVPALLAPVLAGEADVALGSRFTGKITYQVPFLRKCGIALFRGLVSFFLKQPITDPTSGFQAHNRKVLTFFTGDRYPMDYPDSDVLLALHFAGFRIREVPVAMRPRLHGQSMHGGWKTIYYLAKMFLAMSMVLLRHYRSRKPGE